jgi:hypothetical protein
MANNDDNIEFSDELPYSDEKVGNIDESQELSNFEVPEDFNKDKSLTDIATLSKWEKLKRKAKRTWHGKNKVGKYLGLGLDVGEQFAPKWISSIRDIFQSKNNSDMNLVRKAFSIQGIKEFLKVKDEDGNFSWEQVGISLLQVAVFVLLAWLDSQYGLGLIDTLTN